MHTHETTRISVVDPISFPNAISLRIPQTNPTNALTSESSLMEIHMAIGISRLGFKKYPVVVNIKTTHISREKIVHLITANFLFFFEEISLIFISFTFPFKGCDNHDTSKLFYICKRFY